METFIYQKREGWGEKDYYITTTKTFRDNVSSGNYGVKSQCNYLYTFFPAKINCQEDWAAALLFFVDVIV